MRGLWLGSALILASGGLRAQTRLPANQSDTPFPAGQSEYWDEQNASTMFRSAMMQAAGYSKPQRIDPFSKTLPKMEEQYTLERIEKIALESPFPEARLAAVRVYAGSCPDGAGHAVACVTGDSASAGKMPRALDDDVDRPFFQKELIQSLQRIGAKTTENAVRSAALDILIGTMNYMREPTSHYLAPGYAADALGALDHAFAENRQAGRGDAAALTAAIERIQQSLKGSVGVETVPAIKNPMQKAIESVTGKRFGI